MKKLFTILLTMLLMLSLFGCTKKDEPIDGGPGIGIDTSDTIGAVFKNNISYQITDEYVKVVTNDYVYEATLNSDISDKLDAIDFFDEKKDEKYAEILLALPIEKTTLRSEYKLSAEKIASLIGKKGKELVDMGYESVGYNLSEENAVFFMECNGYTYSVVVDEHYTESDSFFAEEVFPDSTIKEIREGY